MFSLIVLVVVCVFTYTIEIVFGLGGTILMIPLLSFWFDTKTLVIFSTVPQILTGTIGLARSPKTVNLKFLGGMMVYAVLGSFAGLYLFYRFSTSAFQVLIASAITLSGLYILLSPKRLHLSPLGARALDTLAGASQALFGISGPIAMMRLLSSFEQKTVIRNYALAFFLSLNIFRAGSYAVQGTFTEEILRMIVVSAPVLAVSLWFSNKLHFHVPETGFRRTVGWIILVGGMVLFAR
jgi:uncharacterized membrane protein YfcA